jgi:hypothetical protein
VARAQHAGDQQAHRIRSQNDSQVSAEAGRDTCVGTRPARPSKLDAFKPYIEERLKAGVWNAQVLLRELRARGFSSGYTILKDWLHPQRTAAQTVAVRRFETPAGKQAQVDRGEGVRRRSCGLPAQALQ